MNDTVARTLLAIAAFLLVTLVMGVFAGPARGVVLCTVALLCLAACRMKLPASPADFADLASGGLWRRMLSRLGRGSGQGEVATRSAADPASYAGVCVLDGEFRVLWCNPSAAAHFGIRPQEATGLPVARVIFAQEFDAWLAAGDYARPLKLHTARGGGATFSISLVPHLHSQWLLLSRDVTQETRAEILRRDGVADALHELCTPVTVLAGHVDTLRRFNFDPRRSPEYLEFMEQQCLRMRSTIGNLVNLWTLESAPPAPTEERVAVCDLLAQVRADMAALSGGRHHIALDAQSGLGLYGCASELASAFRNLAVNAIRYTPAGGAVWIVWRQTAGGAELSVEDNGIGIPREHIPRLTERFYQVDRDASRAAGGSGLGLSIVKNILARHDAALEITSEPGRGSRFAAKFPIGRVLTMAPTTVPADIAAWPAPDCEAGILPVSIPASAAMRISDIGDKLAAHH